MPRTSKDEIRDMILRGSDGRDSPCFGAPDNNSIAPRNADYDKNAEFVDKLVNELRLTPLQE